MGNMTRSSTDSIGAREKEVAMKKGKTGLILTLAAVLIVTISFLGYMIKKQIDYRRWIAYMKSVVEVDTFYEGVSIDGIELGGLTLEEARDRLEEAARSKLEKIKLTLKYHDRRWTLTWKDINARLDTEEKLMQAYNEGREGELEERYNRVQEIRQNGFELHTVLGYDVGLLRDKVEKIAQEIYKEPVDAQIEFFPDKKEKFKITPEQTGLVLDVDKVMDIIKTRIESGEYGEIELVPDEVQPEVFTSDLEKLTHRIVRFSTDLGNSTPERKHNVRLALKKVNGYRLDPGEVFSFNEVVGPRTLARGFKLAPVIFPDKSLQDAPGGGVCQASTTLYNAALRANLEIVERYHHSFPVSYIPIGLDATVSYGGADLKFKNNRETPVFIRTFSSGNRVYVEIYGEPFPNNGVIKCYSTIIEKIPAPKPREIEDKKFKYVKNPGERFEYVKSRPGYRVKSYKAYYENDKLVWKKLIASDYYRPIQGIIYYAKPKPQEGSNSNTTGSDQTNEDSGSSGESSESSGGEAADDSGTEPDGGGTEDTDGTESDSGASETSL